MDQSILIDTVSKHMKLVRIETGYTQDKMAEILGVSKKTLVQIEKERNKASWTVVISICALFKNSSILENIVGGDPLIVVQTLAHEYVGGSHQRKEDSFVWWDTVKEKNDIILEQNRISKFYRIIDNKNGRWYSFVEKEKAESKLDDIS